MFGVLLAFAIVAAILLGFLLVAAWLDVRRARRVARVIRSPERRR